MPDCAGATFPSFASSRPYATDHAAWLRGANRYAGRVGAAAGYVNFHSANYGAGEVFGTVLLGTTAVAFWTDVPASTLGGLAITDVPGLMRASQAYARARGYNAALPTFEEGIASGQKVYGISILSPAAIELREVDGCELGSPDWLDVSGVFKGAHAYAERNGYAGAIPTFERRNPGGGRVIFTLILLRGGHSEWSDVPEPELSLTCGDFGQDSCGWPYGCRAGLKDVFPIGCARVREPPPCGGPGETCCTGRTCDNADLSCNYNGLFRPGICGAKPIEPCGDGVCTFSEACWCVSDCAAVPLCQPSPDFCDGDGTLATYPFCSVCPSEIVGDHFTDHSVTACSEEKARKWLESQYVNCEIRDGACPE